MEILVVVLISLAIVWAVTAVAERFEIGPRGCIFLGICLGLIGHWLDGGFA